MILKFEVIDEACVHYIERFTCLDFRHGCFVGFLIAMPIVNTGFTPRSPAIERARLHRARPIAKHYQREVETKMLATRSGRVKRLGSWYRRWGEM